MEVVNVKVAHIRPAYANLKAWMNDTNKNMYIGRKGVVFVDGARFPKEDSVWANPFKITSNCTREEAVARYEAYIKGRLASGEVNLDSLVGKRLGCWCSPELCHGHVLVNLVAEHVKSGTQVA
ncbi:hypothetical protein DFQ26_007194 [Actinomortierella ambigua]|nr:hypothetical protein DFQ26_007194 [Actinomortierella ambigua]